MEYKWLQSLFIEHELFAYMVLIAGNVFEGLAIPFPFIIIVLIAGAFLINDPYELLFLVLLSSVTYTLASFIPYYLGRKFEYNLVRKKEFMFMNMKHLNTVKKLFNRFGEKIVCISRPLWIGNFVSYFAGITRMNKQKFAIYTFLGILPWHLTILMLGFLFDKKMDMALGYAKGITWILPVILFGLFLVSYYGKKFIKKLNLFSTIEK